MNVGRCIFECSEYFNHVTLVSSKNKYDWHDIIIANFSKWFDLHKIWYTWCSMCPFVASRTVIDWDMGIRFNYDPPGIKLGIYIFMSIGQCASDLCLDNKFDPPSCGWGTPNSVQFEDLAILGFTCWCWSLVNILCYLKLT